MQELDLYIDARLQLFRNYDSVSELSTAAHAIPNGSPVQSTPSSSGAALKSVSEMIAMDLPPPYITNLLLDTYLQSVHWFMIVFHEPTFKIELEELITTGFMPPHRLSFLVLVLLVLAIGAKYASNDANLKHFPDLDWNSLHSKLISKVEEKCFPRFLTKLILSLCKFVFYLGLITSTTANPNAHLSCSALP